MREILFRGKRKHSIDFSESDWVFGDLFTDDMAIYTKLQNLIEIIPETLGQYTRLTDKNGTKIFEGDILKGAWETVFQVVYDDCYLGFRAKEKDGFHNCIDYYGLDSLEVIGNIHDNPELLEVAK